MKRVNNLDLCNIKGGNVVGTLSAALVNSLVNAANTIFEFGRSFGSSIRRVGEGELCPLK